MAESSEFIPTKLHVARAFRGMTQAELANKAALTQGFVCQLERGHRRPTEDVIATIAQALEFAPSFFTQVADDLFGEDECNFRKRKTTPAFVRERLVAQGNVFNLLVRHLDDSIRLPKVSVTPGAGRSPEEIEKSADRCRLAWDVGLNLPLTNIVRTAERQGIVVTRFEGHAAQIDAFSRARAGRRPIIVMNSDKGSTSRGRFDIAHEVGHLVLHEGRAEGDPKREEEANVFGSALLLPREGFCREFPVMTRVDWDMVFRLKSRWKASAAAIVRRAFDLGRIDAVEYRRAYKFMSWKGWLKGEPEEPLEERPEIVPLSLGVLFKRYGTRHADVARILGLTPPVLRDVGVEPCEAESDAAPVPAGRVVPLRRSR